MLGLMKYNFKVYIKNNRFIIPIMFFVYFNLSIIVQRI